MLPYLIGLLMLRLASTASFRDFYCIRHSDNPSSDSIMACPDLKTKSISAAISTNSTKKKNRIIYDLYCDASEAECISVRYTIDTAVDMMLSTFHFELPLYVNMSYFDFCQVSATCKQADNHTIALTYPSTSYVMLDPTDDVARLYPQALLKQFTHLDVKPNWAEYDMHIQFNKRIHWHFVDRNRGTQNDKTDLLLNVLHELMHGLGFITSWSSSFYDRLNPLITSDLDPFITPIYLASISQSNLAIDSRENQPFWGFAEYPFDKFIHFVDQHNKTRPLSQITSTLNRFANSNTTFGCLIDLANAWYKSEEYKTASDIYTKAVTGFDVLAIVNDEPILYLETSINPYWSGSSLCHVDHSKYISSSEYLMVYIANTSLNADEFELAFPEGPIGPNLLKFFSGLGYATNTTYNLTPKRPMLKYWGPAENLVNTPSNPSPAVSVDREGPAHLPTGTYRSLALSFVHGTTWFPALYTYIIAGLLSIIMHIT
ncbi:hypothetical protein BD560DRAFT_385289 [Blakeslea trispora]|nr:hypothetical protein BD560DRAFT_385289 [Blakeslea trispora]